MFVGPAEREGLEMSPFLEVQIASDLRPPLATRAECQRIPSSTLKRTGRKRTLLTVKSYPQTSQDGARLNSADSNEDSSPIPETQRENKLEISPEQRKKGLEDEMRTEADRKNISRIYPLWPRDPSRRPFLPRRPMYQHAPHDEGTGRPG